MTDTPNDPATAELETAGDPRVIGEFDSFDAVRTFVAEDEGELPIMAGDLAVVNGSLVRALPSGMFATVVNLVDEFGAPADHAEAFSRAMTDIEKIVLGAEFSGGSLLNGFINILVQMFKSRPKQWSQMSEGEQRDLKKQLEGHGKDLIRKITRIIAEGEEISVVGKLESFNCKGGFDLKISAPGDEDAVVELFKMVGHEVIIRSADTKQFTGGANDDALIDKDEPPLPFADGPGTFDEEDEEQEDDVEEAPVTDDELEAIAEDVVEEQVAEAEVIEDPINEHIAEMVDADSAEGLAEQAAMNGSEPGPYESRENPEDGDGFTEASEDELAAQRARAQGDLNGKADYVGPTEPKAATVGESWINTSGDDARPKYLHDNGRWYLKPPEAAADPVPAGGEPDTPAETDETGFPDDVD